MQFTFSQGSFSKMTAVFAKCCHLPSPSQSTHSPLHSSFTILLPSSFFFFSLIFEALSCSFITAEHPSARPPPLCCSTLPCFTYPAFTSGLFSLQLLPPGVLFRLTRSVPYSLFVPLIICLNFAFEGEGRARAPH